MSRAFKKLALFQSCVLTSAPPPAQVNISKLELEGLVTYIVPKVISISP